MKHIDIQFKDLPYAVEEALNRLRINIKFCGKNTKKILITSSVPNEGKSSISMNLWRMLAEAGFPSVFVDADLRKSIIASRHKYSIKDNIPDLGYYLSGQAEFDDVVYETNINNGYIVPCCNLLENPSTLLEDVRFKEMLNKLSETYRYVIIDSPPIDSVSDGALIASMCDGAVLVVRGGSTSKNLIRSSMNQLQQVNCKLLGVVLNRVETTGYAYKKYYGKYGKSYTYGYGYGYGHEERQADNDKKTKKKEE